VHLSENQHFSLETSDKEPESARFLPKNQNLCASVSHSLDSAESPGEIPWRCERCDERDGIVVRSVGCQKSQGMSDMTTQTCDKLKEQNRLPTVTPEQLRAVNELRRVLDTDITPVQLAKFVVAEFGRRNPHDWDRTMEENERLMYPGRVAFEQDHNIDFGAVINSIPASAGPSRYAQPPALPFDFPPSRRREEDDRHFSRSTPNDRNFY
jgi:hypothetical protein